MIFGWTPESPAPVERYALTSSRNDVWLVGAHGMVRHFDGQGWQTFDVDTIESLNSVHGLSSGDLWIVGDHGVVRHWSGSTLTAVDTGSDGWLSGVYARAANDVWIVGYGVLHFDGQGWRDRSAEIADWWGGTSVYVAGPGDVWITSMPHTPPGTRHARLSASAAPPDDARPGEMHSSIPSIRPTRRTSNRSARPCARES